MGNKEAEAFRLKWCQLNAGKYTATSQKSEEWRKVDWSRGTYKSLSAIAKAEGGEPEDWAAALTMGLLQQPHGEVGLLVVPAWGRRFSTNVLAHLRVPKLEREPWLQ